MKKEFKNIYKVAREVSKLTQEAAAELIGVSWKTISNYETFTTIPKEEHVEAMIKVYKTPWLAYMHLKQSTYIGRKYLPDINIDDLAKAVLKFQKEMADVESITSKMISIACDGIVEEHERKSWDEIRKEIEEAVGAGIALLYAT